MINPIRYWKLSNFFRSPIATADTSDKAALPKLLNWWDLCAYGISNTVGAGIFVVVGIASKDAGNSYFLTCYNSCQEKGNNCEILEKVIIVTTNITPGLIQKSHLILGS